MKNKTFILTLCLLQVIPLWFVQAQWREVKKLLASDGDGFEHFGKSVSISGNQAIVGADGEDTMGDYTGAAYIFEKNAAGSWGEVTKLTASDRAAYNHFGWSVSISGCRCSLP